MRQNNLPCYDGKKTKEPKLLTQIPKPHRTSLRKFHRKLYTKEGKNRLEGRFFVPYYFSFFESVCAFISILRCLYMHILTRSFSPCD